jgi:serine protease Do
LTPLFVVLTTVWGAQVARGQTDNQLPAGVSVSGAVSDRLGDEWVFHGCGGDVITVTMQSTEFAAFLELYGPSGRDSLTSASAAAVGEAATIAAFTLAESGSYTVIAAGASIRDRGPYSLTLTVSGTTPLNELPDRAVITSGVPVSGEVTDRLGDEWYFRGCAQEAATITMQSDEFDPFIALFGPTGRDALVDTSGDLGTDESQLDALTFHDIVGLLRLKTHL